jgi:hypothetical protein
MNGDRVRAIRDQIEAVKGILAQSDGDPPGITQRERERLESDLAYWRAELKREELNVK